MLRKYSGHSSRFRKPGSSRNTSSVEFSEWFKSILSRFSNFFNFRTGRQKIVISGIAAGIIIAFLVILIIDFHNIKALANFQPNITTKIYDKNDELISELFRQKREELEENELAFFITPRLVKPIAPGIKPELPTDNRPTPEEEKEFEWSPVPRAASR